MSLTKSDKEWVKDVLDITLESVLDKQEQKFEAKIAEIKDDFYTKIDPVLKEVMAAREECELLSNKVYSDHEPRITKVEKKVSVAPVT